MLTKLWDFDPIKRCCALVLCYLALFAFARQCAVAQDELTTLRVDSRLVLLDTSVLDAKGRPVNDLTRDDFDVYENGRAQKIVSFDRSEELRLPQASMKPGVVLDEKNSQQFGRAGVAIFVLDEMNTHFADTSFAVRSLRSYLEKQPAILPQATALFSVNDSRFELLQPYTADRNLLLQALNTHRTVYAWKLERSKSIGNDVVARLDATLSAMEQISQNTARLPVHKSLVWIGAGFPSIDPNSLTDSTQKLLRNSLQHVTDQLLNARVSLYAVDPSSTATGLTEVTDESQLAFIAAAGDGTSRLSDPFDQNLDFNRLATVSGGRVVRGLNNVDQQIDASVRLGRYYYTLGYKPAESQVDEHSYRKIRIVCKRPGTTVLGRDGYYDSTSTPLLVETDVVQSDLNNAAAAQVPFTAIPVRVDGRPGGYRVHVQSSSLDWHLEPNSEQDAHVQVMAVALSGKHAILGHRLQSMTLQCPIKLDARDANHDAVLEIDFAAPHNTKVLRFVVRDAATGRMGTVDLPLVK